MTREEIRKTYTGLKSDYDKRLALLKKRQLAISLLRLLVFAGGGILTAFAFGHSIYSGILLLLTTLVAFLVLVRKSASYSEKVVHTENLISINGNELKCLDGDYSAFDGGSDFRNPDHEFSGDIDIFGEDSLFRYINRTITGWGRTILGQWLADPRSLSDEIFVRQDAIRELAGKLSWRQQFAAYGTDRKLDENTLGSLRSWLDSGETLFSSASLGLIPYIFPSASLICLTLVISGIVPVNVFLFLFVINLFLTGIFLKKINRIHASVSLKHHLLSSVAYLAGSFEKEEFTSSLMAGIRDKIWAGNESVAGKIRQLDRIIQAFDSRLNLFVGFVLNGLLLWDFHCIRKLEKWRASAAEGLPVWLNLLGVTDALISLGNYAYNNPDYCYPGIAGGSLFFEAEKMGHPLLRQEVRIDNDFTLEERQVVIITGANMAGKSTFLRAVATNIVLGMAGAPVCAQKMKLRPVTLFTSMRTTDSLSQNESYFYAELKRLKVLKERIENDTNMLFILDEILKGTNSTDKSIGSKLFLRRVIDSGGTGLIATHDTSLGEMESEFPGNVVNKCFEIGIDGEKILFDYILRNGITRKMNAAILMKQMGIS
jgi:predicted ATPase